ncbi:MAG: PTS sugar transporter subunit IIA [Verrucomicrobia bacterium]|nr:PTS sugar transporter subunit IIA [Verrucomicrobiota bacterium]MBU6445843.1 PTS sugar transporter subunit IIA [Verrucomicrobiota bacterium]MDE3047362.1 PTS sugar transporter subunit IIA [Verrucomicrobiota bacterium]
MMRISDYLDSRLIAFLDVNTRDQAIDRLISLLDEDKVSQERFRKAIHQREQIVSTGIGMGVALPHAKLKELTDFFIVIGIQPKKGLDWNSLDKAPVRLIFMIGGPDDRQTEYLQILSLLTSAIRDLEMRKKLLNATSEEEVLALFSQF